MASLRPWFPLSVRPSTACDGFLTQLAGRRRPKARPFEAGQAAHLNKAIETAKEIGAKLILGRVYHDLGLLHKAKKRSVKAKECISEAIQVFKQCKAEVYLKQANEAFESLQ